MGTSTVLVANFTHLKLGCISRLATTCLAIISHSSRKGTLHWFGFLFYHGVWEWKTDNTVEFHVSQDGDVLWRFQYEWTSVSRNWQGEVRSIQNSCLVFKFFYASYSIFFLTFILRGFGGLEVACWPLVPKFAGSHPAEAVAFLGRKKSSARLPSEGK